MKRENHSYEKKDRSCKFYLQRSFFLLCCPQIKERQDKVMKNAIETKNLTKRYGDNTAVDNLSLTVKEGELFALLGINGAGKTTTIRMLSCLSKPTEGTAKVFNADVMNDSDSVKKMVGISTQDTAVAEKLTVEENLRFMADIYNIDRSSVEKVIEDFNLSEVRKKRAKHLSGGWQRRLSIAMAIIGEPKLLFLDEPTLGLDVIARRELWKEIEKLRSKMTIILTTHYMEEAEALADRIGVMIKGRMVELGTLEELEQRTGKKGLEEVFVTITEREA